MLIAITLFEDRDQALDSNQRAADRVRDNVLELAIGLPNVNVVADDIEVATEFYRTVLGFEQTANADGPMDYCQCLAMV